MDGRGFDAENWRSLRTFAGRCAMPDDVDQGAAVFALGDTFNGRPIAMELPQPVIWYEEDEEFAAVVVQAERHETEDGETLDVLGLVLPMGQTAVALLEDVDEVDATDPVWVSLLEADRMDDEDATPGVELRDGDDDELS